MKFRIIYLVLVLLKGILKTVFVLALMFKVAPYLINKGTTIAIIVGIGIDICCIIAIVATATGWLSKLANAHEEANDKLKK